MKLSQIRKAITTLVGACLAWATLVINTHGGHFPIDSLSALEWLGLATVFTTALGTYAVSNDPKP